MKKLVLSTLLLALFATISYAQPQDREERIKAMRVAFITDQLQLTPEESQNFWPVYNEYQAEQKKLRQQYRPTKNMEAVTEEEAAEIIEASFELEEKELLLKRNYVDRLKNVVPLRKIVKLRQVERNFKQQLLTEIKNRPRRRQ